MSTSLITATDGPQRSSAQRTRLLRLESYMAICFVHFRVGWWSQLAPGAWSFLPRLPENLARAAPLPFIASDSTDKQRHGSSSTAWNNGLVKESWLYIASMVPNKDLIQDPLTCLRNFVTWLARR